MAQNHRPWVPEALETRIARIGAAIQAQPSDMIADRIAALVARNGEIHERDCFNLNPAANVMNPRAEAMLSARGLGTRPSLGYPFDKYEMGLEAVEEIEIIAAALACEIFNATFAEIRVPSGAMANLYGFMATCAPGDTIIAPSPEIGGHVTHQGAGAAGLYGLHTVNAPNHADNYTVDIDALARLAREHRPKLITIGGSLNLFEHPVAEARMIADAVGAKLMFDAAHQCGMIAGRHWKNPLDEGAHFMSFSTYKSLGGPAGGLIVTNDTDLAERFDRIAFPGMTANFDAAKTAALAITLLDWRDFGADYARTMANMARALAQELADTGVPVHRCAGGYTASHQFAIEAARYGGGQAASKHLRLAGLLASGIGLPIAPVSGDLNGLRLGTPELVRWGMSAADAPRLADLITRALNTDTPEGLAAETADWRQAFNRVHFVHTDVDS